MTFFSIVVPVHNEADFLRFTLPFMNPMFGEYVFVLDRCSDDSEVLLNSWRVHKQSVHIYKKDKSTWRNKCAEAFQFGFERAKGDVFLALGADIILDSETFKHLSRFERENLGLIDFYYANWSLKGGFSLIHSNYINAYVKLMRRWRKELTVTGLYAVKRKVLEEIGGLRDVPSEYIDLHNRVRKAGWEITYDSHVLNIHLRPGILVEKQIGQAQVRSELQEYNFLKTMLHGFITVKPRLISAYLKRMFSESKQQ